MASTMFARETNKAPSLRPAKVQVANLSKPRLIGAGENTVRNLGPAAVFMSKYPISLC